MIGGYHHEADGKLWWLGPGNDMEIKRSDLSKADNLNKVCEQMNIQSDSKFCCLNACKDEAGISQDEKTSRTDLVGLGEVHL